MGRRKLFTPEQELAICEEYERIERARPIAEKYGVSDQTIYRVLEKHGIPRTHRHPKPKRSRVGSGHKGIDRAKVCEMYEGGHSTSDIAQQFGCSQTTIYYHLEKAGLYKIGERKVRNDALVPKIVELHERGMSDYEIAEALDVGREAVKYRLRKIIGYRGKGSNSKHGGDALAAKRHQELIARIDTLSDFDVIGDGSPVKVRCKKCGTEFEWIRDFWRAKVPCPGCRERQRAESERKEYERRQQLIAAHEWLLSTPRICKECGEPFFSEHHAAAYCCDACRKRANNRKAAIRRKRRGTGANGYKNRMRIEITRLTYDRTLTRPAVYKKFHGRCCMCGCKTVLSNDYRPNQATLDHKTALANNGTHTWDNAQLLCNECNVKKGIAGQMRLAIA